MAAAVLPVVDHTPVLAGVNGTDPFLLTDRFLRELADLGFNPLRLLHRRRARDDPRGRRPRRLPPGADHRRAIGAGTAKSLDDCAELVDEWSSAAREVRDDVLVLCHGCPISSPDDAAYVLERTRYCHGFYGASSMERLPTEQALTAQARAFKTRLRGTLS